MLLPFLHRELNSWDYISKIGNHIITPWVLLGDFNQVLEKEIKLVAQTNGAAMHGLSGI